MLKPGIKTSSAIKGMAAVSGAFVNEYILYLKECREYEIGELVLCEREDVEQYRGRVKILTEQINLFNNLVPR